MPGQVDAIEEGKSGLTCVVKDSESLLNSMEKMLNEAYTRKEMSEYAVCYVRENYEQQKLFKKLNENRQILCKGKVE